MATLVLEGGADIRSVQEMLGHESRNTTQIYTRVSVQRLAAVHAATHPGLRPRGAPEAKAEPDHDAATDEALVSLSQPLLRKKTPMREHKPRSATMNDAMNPRVKAILEQVSQLTEDERMELEDEMLLGAPAEQEAIEKAWADELVRRIADVDSGRVKMIPVEEAMARLRARVGE